MTQVLSQLRNIQHSQVVLVAVLGVALLFNLTVCISILSVLYGCKPTCIAPAPEQSLPKMHNLIINMKPPKRQNAPASAMISRSMPTSKSADPSAIPSTFPVIFAPSRAFGDGGICSIKSFNQWSVSGISYQDLPFHIITEGSRDMTGISGEKSWDLF